MDKLYKIYFNGAQVVTEECIWSNNSITMCYYIYKDIEHKQHDWTIKSEDMGIVLIYSLGDIRAYTHIEGDINVLTNNIKDAVFKYHNDAVNRMSKEIDKHNEILQKLFYLN